MEYIDVNLVGFGFQTCKPTLHTLHRPVHYVAAGVITWREHLP